MSKHRKQASITNAETHTVFPKDLELTHQLIRFLPFNSLTYLTLAATTHTAQCADVSLCTLLVVEFTKALPSPNQVSLAGTIRLSRKRMCLLLADIINNI